MTYSLQLYTAPPPLGGGPGRHHRAGGRHRLHSRGALQLRGHRGRTGRRPQANGLTAPSGHAPLLSQDQDEIFAAAQELGISTVIDPYVPAEHWPGRRGHPGTAAASSTRPPRRAPNTASASATTTMPGSWSPASTATRRWSTCRALLDPEWCWKWTPTGPPSAARTRWSCCAGLGERVKFIHIKDGPADHGHQGPAAGRLRARCPIWDVIAAAQVPGSRRRGIRRLRRRHLRRHRRQPCTYLQRQETGLNHEPASTASRQGRARSASPSSAPAVISKEYLDNLTSFPDLKVHVIADLFEEAAASARPGIRHPRLGRRRRGTEPSRRRDRRQPDHPGRARGGGHGGRQRRQARLEREAVLAGPRKRAGAAQGRRRGRAPAGLRPGHLPGRRACRPPARIIDRGDIGTPLTALTLLQSPGPESWHPNPAFLFQDGAGPAVRHRARTTSPRWCRPSAPSPRWRPSAPKPGEARVIGSGPQAGRGIRRRRPHPRQRDRPVRGRRILAEHLQLRLPRCSGPVSWRSPGPRPPSRCRTRTCFDGDIAADAPRRGGAGRSSPPSAPASAAASACWTWPAPSAPASRTGPRDSWPTTCSTPWSRSPSPSTPATFVDARRARPRPPSRSPRTGTPPPPLSRMHCR